MPRFRLLRPSLRRPLPPRPASSRQSLFRYRCRRLRTAENQTPCCCRTRWIRPSRLPRTARGETLVCSVAGTSRGSLLLFGRSVRPCRAGRARSMGRSSSWSPSTARERNRGAFRSFRRATCRRGAATSAERRGMSLPREVDTPSARGRLIRWEVGFRSLARESARADFPSGSTSLWSSRGAGRSARCAERAPGASSADARTTREASERAPRAPPARRSSARRAPSRGRRRCAARR